MLFILFDKLFSSQEVKTVFSHLYVILQIGVTSAAVPTKNVSLNSHNLLGLIFSLITSIFNISLAI
jgi:hypothetical protein